MLAAAGISDALRDGAAAIGHRSELLQFLNMPIVDSAVIEVFCSCCAQRMACEIGWAWANLHEPITCSFPCWRNVFDWPSRKVDLNRWWPDHLTEKRARLGRIRKNWNPRINMWDSWDFWQGDLTDGEGRLKL
jgi:hypothetical protein